MCNIYCLKHILFEHDRCSRQINSKVTTGKQAMRVFKS